MTSLCAVHKEHRKLLNRIQSEVNEMVNIVYKNKKKPYDKMDEETLRQEVTKLHEKNLQLNRRIHVFSKTCDMLKESNARLREKRDGGPIPQSNSQLEILEEEKRALEAKLEALETSFKQQKQSFKTKLDQRDRGIIPQSNSQLEILKEEKRALEAKLETSLQQQKTKLQELQVSQKEQLSKQKQLFEVKIQTFEKQNQLLQASQLELQTTLAKKDAEHEQLMAKQPREIKPLESPATFRYTKDKRMALVEIHEKLNEILTQLVSESSKAVIVDEMSSICTTIADLLTEEDQESPEFVRPTDRLTNAVILAFLHTIPMFQSLTESQMETLAYNVKVEQFAAEEYIVRQDDIGHTFYMIESGEVYIRKREPNDSPTTDGAIIATLSAGNCFGERALMKNDRRAASVQAKAEVICLTVQKQVFQKVLSNSVDLLEGYTASNSKVFDEISSLDSHIKTCMSIQATECDLKATLTLQLSSAFAPELELDDIIERMIRALQETLECERIGFFLVTPDRTHLDLRISRDTRGILVPMAGIAGHTAKTGKTVNIPDAYNDARFDTRMDKKTGHRTTQILCVPIFCPGGTKTEGVLQSINRSNDMVGKEFSQDELELAETTARYIGLVLEHKRVQSGHDETTVQKISAARNENFTFRITGASVVELLLQNSTPRSKRLTITVRIFHGEHLLCKPNTLELKINAKDKSYQVVDIPVEIPIPIGGLPQATKIVFDLKCKNTPVGWAGQYAYEFDNALISGTTQIYLFGGSNYSPTSGSIELEDPSKTRCSYLKVEYPDYEQPIEYTEAPDANSIICEPMVGGTLERVQKIIQDPFHVLSQSERTLIWSIRSNLVKLPDALPWFLSSVNWSIPCEVREAHQLLYMWTPPTAVQALGLLSCKFPDPKIRAYAVQTLEKFPDEKMASLLLQMTQAVRNERYHDSALCRFLIRRALLNPKLLGHRLFWYCKSEMHDPDVRQRYGIMLQTYLKHCGAHRVDIGHQSFLMRKLESIHKTVLSNNNNKNETLRAALKSTIFPETFTVPIDPDFLSCGIDIEKCFVFSSKQQPFRLVFLNADPDGEPKHIMYKNGDDLRQDQLVLQVLGTMDSMWKDAGLDTRMIVYGCISTGENCGMIEYVQNSTTIAGIVSSVLRHKGTTRSKLKSALLAIESTVIENWLLKSRYELKSKLSAADKETLRQDPLYQQAVEMFWRSCAGYCVATYVLGVGDRHNDNIMIKNTGQMFHIDYGHIFGNFKSKMGIKRERAMFVFTPAFARVIGKKDDANFKAFFDLSCKAYNVLRENASVLYNLCAMMLNGKIKELEDFEWMHTQLQLHLDPAEASLHLTKLILKSWKTRTIQLNDAAHMLKHG